jgi:outer membrane biosynthesis protein TonB
MMEAVAFRNEEKIGLAAAVVLHGALVAVLLSQAVRSEISVFPERMTVSLATEVGLEAASPDPVAESRAAIAPTLSDSPAPAPEPAPAPPERVERASPPPKSQPTRAARPTPAPTQPAPSRDRSRPDRTPAPKASNAPAPRPSASPAPARTAERSGGSRIGDDFLEGRGSSTSTTETRAPAATFGRAERAALSSAITRQLRPHWTAPSGLEAELLISTVSWDLSPDGTLRGTPRCRTDPASITDSNRPQAGLHCERAIRAVQRAAPFNLPEQFYDRWKALEWQFDRRL